MSSALNRWRRSSRTRMLSRRRAGGKKKSLGVYAPAHERADGTKRDAVPINRTARMNAAATLGAMLGAFLTPIRRTSPKGGRSA